MNAPAFQRYRLIVEYDGTPFHGWQLQPETRTVQGEIEAVLARITEAPRRVIGSGRTDTGVHATGQVAAVDLPPKWEAAALQKALNALLPREIRVREVHLAPPRFHPRYDAVARSYRYQVGTTLEAGSPFHRRWCWDLSEAPPDRDLLQAGAALIAGDRSFARFAKSGQPARGDRCRVASAAWEPCPEIGISFRITANRYLHHMVRYLVGTMIAVGRGERPLDELAALLENDRSPLVTSPPAPARGLFLERVEYPQKSFEPPPPNEGESAP